MTPCSSAPPTGRSGTSAPTLSHRSAAVDAADTASAAASITARDAAAKLQPCASNDGVADSAAGHKRYRDSALAVKPGSAGSGGSNDTCAAFACEKADDVLAHLEYGSPDVATAALSGLGCTGSMSDAELTLKQLQPAEHTAAFKVNPLFSDPEAVATPAQLADTEPLTCELVADSDSATAYASSAQKQWIPAAGLACITPALSCQVRATQVPGHACSMVTPQPAGESECDDSVQSLIKGSLSGSAADAAAAAVDTPCEASQALVPVLRERDTTFTAEPTAAATLADVQTAAQLTEPQSAASKADEQSGAESSPPHAQEGCAATASTAPILMTGKGEARKSAASAADAPSEAQRALIASSAAAITCTKQLEVTHTSQPDLIPASAAHKVPGNAHASRPRSLRSDTSLQSSTSSAGGCDSLAATGNNNAFASNTALHGSLARQAAARSGAGSQPATPHLRVDASSASFDSCGSDCTPQHGQVAKLASYFASASVAPSPDSATPLPAPRRRLWRAQPVATPPQPSGTVTAGKREAHGSEAKSDVACGVLTAGVSRNGGQRGDGVVPGVSMGARWRVPSLFGR